MYRVTIHKAFLFALAVLLALTSQSMAVARGATDPSGQMVICSGSGPVTLYVDEDGQPIKPPQYCPDCALHVLDGVAAPDPAADRVGHFSRQFTVFSALFWVDRFRPDASARGPPVIV